MKSGVIIGLIFVTVFMLTSVGLIYLNSKYTNMWKFDFSPYDPVKAELDKKKQDSIYAALQGDSLSVPDSSHVQQNEEQAKENPDAKKEAEKKTPEVKKGEPEKKAEQQPAEKPKDPEQKVKEEKSIIPTDKGEFTKKMDPDVYKKWKKQTVKILEAMDSKKASQILKLYSDNIARELIYSMNNKKAAEILSKLDPATVQKITKVD